MPVAGNASQGLTESDPTTRFYQRESSLSALESVPSDNLGFINDKYIMLNFSAHLQWFQAKIGSYDKQIWETSVEQRILQGLENRPKKEGSLHKELIDIDLVRGSTFSKAKPRHGLKSVIFNGLKKVIFFPYYFKQWRDHLNRELVYCFMFHYIIQLIQLALYFWWSNSSEIMLEEILLPIVLALSLGILHAHIIAPYSVKQRRKKTFSTSCNKPKSTSKTEGNVPQSKSFSGPYPLTTQLSDPSHQIPKENFKPDTVPPCQETPLCNRIKKKNVFFSKSPSANSELSDDDGHRNKDTKIVQPEGYDGETETKDSSSSEHGDSTFKTVDVDCDNNDPSCTEAVCCGTSAIKSVSKRSKIPDGTDRSTSYTKIKPLIRKCSQSEVVTVTDEEDLKKFISAKNKHIPDPTPITSSKKDKEKNHRKQSNGVGNILQKSGGYKSGKSRRQNSDRTGNNSGMSSGSASTGNVLCNHTSNPVDLGNKVARKSSSSSTVTVGAVTESSILCALEDIDFSEALNGNVTNQETITDHSSDDLKFANNTIETIVSKTPLIFNEVSAPVEPKISHSQPHTPINHAGNRSRLRIEVRKVSSADASPTPSRKNSVPFIKPSISEDHSIPQSPSLLITENHIQTIIACTNDNTNKVIDASISSEDYSSKAIDLNEDTITKSHKKREEFKQLFELKAQAIQIEKGPSYNSAGKSASSTSSSRNSTTDIKHGKTKRRHREDYKLSSNVERIGKHRKEMVQSMSETEYDRMNSDVNSTGNSTSDAEDMCQELPTAKSEVDNQEETEQKSEKVYEEHILEIGACSNVLSNNENNVVVEDITRPLQSGDIFQPEMAPDDPFVMWYKEAHTPGMTGSVSCYIWENDELKKTNLSLLDIGWSIIQAVERHVQDKSYSTLGFFTIIVLCFTPVFFRMYVNRAYLYTVMEMSRHSDLLDMILPHNNTLIQSIVSAVTSNTSMVLASNLSTDDHVYSVTNEIIPLALTSALASEWPIRIIIVLGVILRLILYTMTFLMLCVAENSFEQRLQYAKHFCRLTSSRRARKYYLPHFRLNKLANIKCWLSLRSYLKKRGPQRSVESIISSAFYMLLAMLSLVCVNLLQSTDNLFINRLINWDLMLCSVALGVFMMRFLVLGTKITKKYRNLSVIITEQINLFLAMQTRPHKKEELTLAHNVLRLAESLLKEVEGPFRICGWSMNPFLYNILKVVILSVFSTVLSETCGFKMKLYKIKINPANW